MSRLAPLRRGVGERGGVWKLSSGRRSAYLFQKCENGVLEEKNELLQERERRESDEAIFRVDGRCSGEG